MRIEVYELRREEDRVVLDETRLHCVITVENRVPHFQFSEGSNEELIRKLFDREAHDGFSCGGTNSEGECWDAVTVCPAWSQKAIQAIIKKDLHCHNLCAKVWYDEPEGKSLPILSIDQDEELTNYLLMKEALKAMCREKDRKSKKDA